MFAHVPWFETGLSTPSTPWCFSLSTLTPTSIPDYTMTFISKHQTSPHLEAHPRPHPKFSLFLSTRITERASGLYSQAQSQSNEQCLALIHKHAMALIREYTSGSILKHTLQPVNGHAPDPSPSPSPSQTLAHPGPHLCSLHQLTCECILTSHNPEHISLHPTSQLISSNIHIPVPNLILVLLLPKVLP